MKEGTKSLIAMGIVLGIVVGLWIGIGAYSSVDPPFSVIQSGSMQHSRNESALGILDTGDMVLVRDPSKVHIRSYVEGRIDNYSSFGEYGDVIIYKRPNQTPVIHRAMLWIDYNGDGTWTAEALKNYPMGQYPDGLWYNEGRAWDDLKGVLTLYDVGYGHATVSITLSDSLGSGGFLTKGDNKETNPYFDQYGASIFPRLVTMEDIRSVPVAEIPWLGCIKMHVKGTNTANIPTNSVPSLVFFFITIFSAVAAIVVVYQSIHDIVAREKKK